MATAPAPPVTDGRPGHIVATRPGWESYADLLLRRAALLARAGRGRPADPLAGLRVSDERLDALLQDVPGLRRPADPALLADLDAQTAGWLDAAEPALVQSILGDGPLGRVISHSGLTLAEATVLAVLVAVELDPARQQIVGYLNDDVTQRFVTPATLQALARTDDDAAQLLLACGPGGGLRRAGLLQPASDAPWSAAAIRLHPQVLWWLAGDRTRGEDLPDGTRLVSVPGRGEADLVVVSGPDRIRRTQAVVGALTGTGFLITPVPAEKAGWEPIVRYASLSGCAVIVETDGALPAHAAARVDAATQLAWAICSAGELPLGCLPQRSWLHVPVAPSPAEPAEIAALLAEQVPPASTLTTDQLELVAAAAPALAGDTAAAIRRLAAGGISQLAERIVPSRKLADLVVAPSERDLLGEIVARTRHRQQVFQEWAFDSRSSGVLAMFVGPPGTGKTLAAEVIAGELGLDLYRVDLSQVVDKYIGETEKKLAEVFDAAEASPIVLFLDEADALLGKRTDVADAHDRYANIEVAYLLQRLERHTGIVVFASNLAGNIDEAFQRRIHVSVQFVLPQAAERREIWRRSVPAAVPSAGVDWDALADGLELSGGQIRNIAVRAAFLAAEAGSALTMPLLLESAGRELKKSGRLFPTERFR